MLRDVVKWFLYSFAFGVLLVGDLAQATDAQTAGTAVDIPYRPYDDWTGFYLGGHVGYGRGHANVTVQDSNGLSSSRAFGSLFGGMQFGYNYLFSSHLLLGLEADISFPNYLG